MNKIVKYIKKNWNKLPKSTFNEEEVVIFDTVENSNEGYGHHSYEGYGVDKKGNIVVCTSSGCSCSGGCGTNPLVSVGKTDERFDNYNPEFIDFGSQEVTFSDY